MDPSREEMEDERYEGRRDRSGGRGRDTRAMTNEYFIPKDGIDREVITADICRYLGNKSLVRPGNYENPQTRQIQQGYFVRANRKLTTAMITDLKADSERWEAERRTSDKRSRPSIGISVLDSDDITQQFNHLIGEYRGSITHQSRQYYGPTEVAPGSPTSLGYAMPSTSQSTNPYFPGPYYSQQVYYSNQPEPPVSSGQYSSPSIQTYYSHPNASLHNYYPTSSQAQPLVTSATSTTSAQYSLLPTDSYDGGVSYTQPYDQANTNSVTITTGASINSRRESLRDRDRDRDRDYDRRRR